MFVLLTLSKEHPLLAAGENQPLDMQAMSLLVHNAVKANFPDTIDPAGKVNFNWVTNRKQHNHVQFLVQLPSVAVDALLMITAMGPFPEAERQEFLEELLNGKDISSLVMNPAVSVTYKYHYEIMGTIGDKIIGDIGASLLRGETGQDDDVFCMFYPVADTVVFDQFSKQENLDNWTLTRGSKIAQSDVVSESAPAPTTTASSEPARKGVVKFEQMLPVPAELGEAKCVIGFTAADYNDKFGFDGAPIELYRYSSTGLEFVDDIDAISPEEAEYIKLALEILTTGVSPIVADTDYAQWMIGNSTELLGPGSYLLFGFTADCASFQTVKYVRDDTPDVTYVQVGEITHIKAEGDHADDSSN